MLLAQLSASFQSLPPLPTSRLGPSGADSWVGGFCVYSRTFWVSATNSPVRLGVSPTAASTSTGVFSQRFEAFFPRTRTLGCMVYRATQLFLLVYLHKNVGTPSPPATAFRESSPPGCPSAPLLPVWMNVSSLAPWLSDFHTV